MVVYCPETGYSENAVGLSLSADRLIVECACSSCEFNEQRPYLNSEAATRQTFSKTVAATDDRAIYH